MPEPVATHLRQPYTVECDSEQDAINLAQASKKITSRKGVRVTFHRSSWMRNLGTKPKPTEKPKPIVARTEHDFR